MIKKYFLIGLIILLSSIPRSIELLNNNYLFGFDQGIFFQAVKKIVIDHKLTLIGAEVGGGGGFFQGPGWYYLLSIPFAITKGNPYGGMVLMFILGISTVYFTYYFGKKMFGEKTALVIAFLVGVSPTIITQSRFIWPPFPISFLTVFMLFFLYKVFQRKRHYFPFLIFTIGVIGHFEMAVAGTLLIQIIIITPLLWIKKYVSLKVILMSILSFAIALLPLLIFDLRHEFISSKGVLKLFSNPNKDHHVTFVYVTYMFKNHLDMFKYSFLGAFDLSRYLWLSIVIVLFFGSIVYVKDKRNVIAKKIIVLYLLLSPFLLFAIFMLYEWPMWDWWIIELPIFYCFLLGIVLVYLWRFNTLKILIVLFVFINIVSFGIRSYNNFKNDFNDFGGVHKIKGKLQAIDFIYKDAGAEPFSLLVFTPPIYTYAYDYLIWWRGEEKYHYIPSQEKKGTFYLLIEPDPHKPWTYRGWLETVVKSGKIVYEKKLPSGFIIQKRIAEM